MSYKDHVSCGLFSKSGEKELPCLICGQGSDPLGMGRDRTKPKWEDFTVIPLCRYHHHDLHQIGLLRFEKKYKINLYKEALIILAKWIYENE